MEENKKALSEDETKNNNNIIPEKLAKNNVFNNMPTILNDILNLYTKRFINLSTDFILNILIAKMAQMITSKRVNLREVDHNVISNWFAMIFAPSGYGKDRLIRALNDEIFKNFRDWFKQKAKEHKEYREKEIENKAKENEKKYNSKKQDIFKLIKEEKEEIRDLILEVQDGTQEGLYQDAKAFNNSGSFGSMMILINEFSSYIETLTTTSHSFINALHSAYDGRVISKSTKTFKREPDIENIPVNALLYSDYTLFSNNKNVKNIFLDLLHTGLGRRCQISFISSMNKLKTDSLKYEEEQSFYNKAIQLGNELHSIFSNINFGNCYFLTESAKNNILNAYKDKLTDLFNNSDDELLKKEVKSRELKALKLSCIYAALNHPQETIINDTDITQAIDTVEYLSSGLKDLLEYRPNIKDKYDVFYKFLKDNLGRIFNTGELKKGFKEVSGLSRDKIGDSFDKTIETIKELAAEDNYTLAIENINNNTGKQYVLYKKPNEELNENILDLEKLI